MLLGRTDSRHHSQLRQPTLSNHGEAGGSDQRHQEQDDRGHDEHDHRGDETLGHIASRRHLPISLTWRSEGLQLILTGIDQHRDEFRACDCGRWQEDELIIEVARILDDSDDGTRTAVEVDRRADPGMEGVSDPIGHRGLVVCSRIPARSQIEQRRSIWAVGLL